MKKRKLIRVLIIVAIVFVCALLVGYRLFFSTAAIKPGDLIASYDSPGGEYQLCLYNNDGGATVDNTVLGVIYKTDSHYTRNIYWEYHCNDASVEWVDNDTVVINGKRIENVLKDKYDFRYSNEKNFVSDDKYIPNTYFDTDGYSNAGKDLEEYFCYSYNKMPVLDKEYKLVTDENINDIETIASSYDKWTDNHILSMVSKGDYFILYYYDTDGNKVDCPTDNTKIYFYDTQSNTLHYIYYVL